MNFDALLCDGVDDIDAAFRRLNRDIQALPVLADRDVVRMPGQRNLLRDSQRLRIDDVERRRRLVAEIQPAPVRRCGHAMDDFGVGNLADDLVGGRVDQVHAVAGGIGLDDDGGLMRR